MQDWMFGTLPYPLPNACAFGRAVEQAGPRGHFDQRGIPGPTGPEQLDDGTVDLGGGERGEQRQTAGRPVASACP